jgi:hypothetical protein
LFVQNARRRGMWCVEACPSWRPELVSIGAARGADSKPRDGTMPRANPAVASRPATTRSALWEQASVAFVLLRHPHPTHRLLSSVINSPPWATSPELAATPAAAPLVVDWPPR